jgi:hypothetical protein
MSSALGGVSAGVDVRENGLVDGTLVDRRDGATDGAELNNKLTLGTGGMMGGMGIAVVLIVDFSELKMAITTNTRHAATIMRVTRMAIAKYTFIFDVDVGSSSTLPVTRFLVNDKDMLAVDMTDATSSGMAARSRVVDVHKSLAFGPQGCIVADGL